MVIPTIKWHDLGSYENLITFSLYSYRDPKYLHLDDSSGGYKYTPISIKKGLASNYHQKHTIHKYSQLYSNKGSYSHARRSSAGTTPVLLI